jgi:sugar lactone lactonase YvrE
MRNFLIVGTGIFFLLFLVSCSNKVEPNPIWMLTWDARIGEETNKELAFPDSMDLDTDGDGNVYVFSNIYSNEKFDHKNWVRDANSRPSHRGDSTTYLQKYTPDGKLIWEKFWDFGMPPQSGKKLAVSESGKIYLTGEVSKNNDLDPGDGVFKSNVYDRCYYISCLDTDGEFQWGRFLISEICSIGSDKSEEVYYAGTLRPFFSINISTSQFDLDPGPGEDLHTSISSDDYFLAKLDASGDYQWGKTWTTYQTGSFPDLYVNSIGDALIACQWSRPVDFQNPTTVARSGPDDQDICLAMFNSSGDLQWVTNWGGKEICRVNDVTADGSGNIYISGSTFTPKASRGKYKPNPYLAKFKLDGEPIWRKMVDGYLGSSSLAIDRKENLIVPLLSRSSYSLSNDSFDIGFSAYSPSGDHLKTILLGSKQHYAPIVISIDPSGYIYTAGTKGEKSFLAKFSPDPNVWGR